MKNIIFDENICSGAPTIRNRRLTVFNIVSKIFYEINLETALQDFEISIEIAKEAVSYCRNLDCQKDRNLIKFCSGCILRTLQEGWHFDKSNYDEIHYDSLQDSISIDINGQQIFIGSIQQLENSEFGKVGWLLASDLIEKYAGLG